MQIGLNAKTNRRVHIEDANIDEEYVCPYCKERLIQRKGNINIHHFAHYKLIECENEGKTEWHYAWQNEFSPDNQEVIVDNECQGMNNHIADVCLNNIVIEFQIKCSNNAELYLRTAYYTFFGYKLIWVIDAIDAYGEGRLFYKRDNHKIDNQEIYQWDHASRALGVFLEDIIHDFNNKIDLFLDLGKDNGLIKVCWAPLIEYEERRNMKHISGIPCSRQQFLQYIRRNINNNFFKKTLSDKEIERIKDIQEW